uniref:Uncharacterized protein n=1 Tax=Arundo donax TaxID=35708 RepID=A0A0A9GWK6_ARUDO
MVGVRVHTGDRTPMELPAITRTVTPSAVVDAMSLLWISWYPGSTILLPEERLTQS